MTAPAGDERPVTTLTCPDCAEEITGTVGGRGSATFRLASHRWNRHGVRSSGKKPTKAEADANTEALVSRPALTTVREIGTAAGAGKRGTPTGAELAQGLGRGLSITTLIGASFVVETDPNIPPGPAGDAIREQTIEALILSDKAAADMLAPLGRAFAGTGLNKRYGRGLVDNVDALASVGDLVMFGRAWYVYLSQRTRGIPPAAAAGPALAAPFGPVDQYGRPVDERGTPTTPPPTQGRVITADDVAAMRSNAI